MSNLIVTSIISIITGIISYKTAVNKCKQEGINDKNKIKEEYKAEIRKMEQEFEHEIEKIKTEHNYQLETLSAQACLDIMKNFMNSPEIQKEFTKQSFASCSNKSSKAKKHK